MKTTNYPLLNTTKPLVNIKKKYVIFLNRRMRRIKNINENYQERHNATRNCIRNNIFYGVIKIGVKKVVSVIRNIIIDKSNQQFLTLTFKVKLSIHKQKV